MLLGDKGGDFIKMFFDQGFKTKDIFSSLGGWGTTPGRESGFGRGHSGIKVGTVTERNTGQHFFSGGIDNIQFFTGAGGNKFPMDIIAQTMQIQCLKKLS